LILNKFLPAGMPALQTRALQLSALQSQNADILAGKKDTII
jgi:hypothetical protein